MIKEKQYSSPYVIFNGTLLIQDEPSESYKRKDDINQAESKATNHYSILEQYYSDIYRLFLNKLSTFDHKSITTEVERTKLKALLSEIVYVKELLEQER